MTTAAAAAIVRTQAYWLGRGAKRHAITKGCGDRVIGAWAYPGAMALDS